MAKLLARFPKSSNKTWLMGSWIRQCTLFKFANYYCQVTINFTGQVLAVIGRALRGPVVGATSNKTYFTMWVSLMKQLTFVNHHLYMKRFMNIFPKKRPWCYLQDFLVEI